MSEVSNIKTEMQMPLMARPASGLFQMLFSPVKGGGAFERYTDRAVFPTLSYMFSNAISKWR
jgi:hypothetical protein